VSGPCTAEGPRDRIERRASRLSAGWLLPPSTGVLVAALLWGAGFLWFAHALPSAVADLETPTDAIVVLTGGRLRIDEGMALLAQGKGKRLFVSGVHPGVTLPEILHLSPETPDWARCCVDLGYAADNTLGNAQETARWMRAHDFRSLRLVTAGYHMPRALLELRHAFPEAMIVAHPVFPQQVRQRDWWAWPGSAWLIAGEYNKFLGAFLRSLVHPAPPAPPAA
jgi:uncharacterized SAM-binding protein YcdF (DUF218 family)